MALRYEPPEIRPATGFDNEQYTDRNGRQRVKDTGRWIDDSGNTITGEDMQRAVDDSIALTYQNVERLVMRHQLGEISKLDLRLGIRREVRNVHYRQFIMGRGGRDADVTTPEWGALGNLIKKQYSFYDRSASQFMKDNISIYEFARRVRLNVSASNYVFERGKLYNMGIPTQLHPPAPFSPGKQRQLSRDENAGRETEVLQRGGGIRQKLACTPGDGTTRCGGNCRCHLDIRPDPLLENTYVINWITARDGNVCPDCISLSGRYTDYRITLE